MKIQILHLSFFFLSVIHLSAVAFEWQAGIYFTKPLLMVSLGGWLYMSVRPSVSVFIRYILAGLVFSAAGDTFLMFAGQAPDLFLFGLGSFLITHLLYTSAFTRIGDFREGLLKRRSWLMVPVLFYLAGMILFLWNDLSGAFRLPVVIYSTVISVMLLSAIHAAGRVSNQAAVLWVAGAMLFVISDSVIAIRKFTYPDALPEVYYSLLIMTTYISGQYLIARGCREADIGR